MIIKLLNLKGLVDKRPSRTNPPSPVLLEGSKYWVSKGEDEDVDIVW